MEWITAKSILQRVPKDGQHWFGIEYNMNLYKGCCHNCIYCDSRSDCYQTADFSRVRGKAQALEILLQELSSKRRKGVVSLGAMSDAYNPWEEQHQLTRGALALLARYGFGVSIETKSDLITRDIDLLQQITACHSAIIKLTVTTPDDELAKVIEPGAPPPSRRLAALGELRRAGLYAGVLMMPILPWLTDAPEAIDRLVRLAYEQGAQFIYPMWGVTLRDSQRWYFYEQLDQHFPGLRQRYQETFGQAYVCLSPQAEALEALFEEACRRYGLRWRMQDIIDGYRRPPEAKQLTLF